MPSVPRPALIVIEAKLVLGGLETVLDGPTMTLDGSQRGYWGSGRTPGREECHLAVGDVAADQQSPRPYRVFCAAELTGQVGEFHIAPLVQPRPLGPGPGRQTLPLSRGTGSGDLFGAARD